MKKPCLILLALVLVWPAALLAQGVDIGFKLGASLATLGGSQADEIGDGVRVGPAAGASVRFRPARPVGVRLELL